MTPFDCGLLASRRGDAPMPGKGSVQANKRLSGGDLYRFIAARWRREGAFIRVPGIVAAEVERRQ